ncbi:MAG: glycine cleavage system protein GcvH [Armatimonadetes bacterium]|jgi:glycine cleavage system H protein|nr:glycine cleavage system protein GcvH [Armatimonadota bacterium]
MANVPADLKYTKSHEWVRVDGNLATIGITDHAQSELGDIVFVDLPAVGAEISQGNSFGTVESVKTAADVYAPISGKVVAANAGLGSASELMNSDPYGDGYMVTIEMSDASQLDGLLDAAAYSALL